MHVVTSTDIKEYPLASRGKVRDIYELTPETLLIVTTDRMSAFDVVMAEPVPHKGVVLNLLTIHWMNTFSALVPNHLLETEVRDFPKPLHAYADMLEGRAVVVRKTRPLPVECIVRGHITGSGWKDYQANGTVCGHRLPKGLRESDKLPFPLFTPSTKAELGQHDENISLREAMALAGGETVLQAGALAVDMFKEGRDMAEARGIIIADTKFEFGLDGNEVILIDEVLTPDSSRFWPKEGFVPGRAQPSFDKQYLRDWLSAQPWNKQPPPPTLPEEVIAQTRKRYLEAYTLLTGRTLSL